MLALQIYLRGANMFFSRRIIYFFTLSELLSYKIASEKLSITTVALKHSISCLEEHYGQVLFTKQSGSLALTPAGDMLFRCLNPLYGKIEKIIDSLKGAGDWEGVITLGLDGFYNPEIARKVNKIISEKRVKVIINISQKSSYKDLLDNKCNIGFCYFFQNHPCDNNGLLKIILPTKRVGLLVHKCLFEKYKTIEALISNEILFQRTCVLEQDFFVDLTSDLHKKGFKLKILGLPDFCDIVCALKNKEGASIVTHDIYMEFKLDEFVYINNMFDYKVANGVYFYKNEDENIINMVDIMR